MPTNPSSFRDRSTAEGVCLPWREYRRAAVLFASLTCTSVSAVEPAKPAADSRLGVVELRIPGRTPVRLYAESYALVIGAAHYRKGWPDLPGVEEDVQAVAKLLAERGFSVTTLPDPTRDELDKALRRFVELHGQSFDARLVFYFAGHGYTVKTAAGGKLGYLVPVDAPKPGVNGANLAAFKASAYSMESIEVLARQIDAKHTLFIFDSCFSGALFRLRGDAVPDSISEYTAYPVRQFITAGDENQQVPDQSIFRRRLEAGLRGEADLNGDGYITASELGIYLQDTVTNESRRAQTPHWGKINDASLSQGDFVFTSPTAGAKHIPPVAPMAAAPTIARGAVAEPSVAPARSRAASLSLQPRLDGAAFYLPELDLTIIADGNLVKSMPLSVPRVQGDGTMSRATADAWIAAINASGYLGFRDWRLPRARPINGAVYKMAGSDDGSTDLGYNLSAPGTPFEGSTASELAYLYYNVVGAHGAHSIDGKAQNVISNRFEPLRDVAFRSYWVQSDARLGTGSLAFSFEYGTQYMFDASTPEAPEQGWKFNVIAVRSGDVGNGSTARN